MTDDIVTRLRTAHEQSARYPRLLLSKIEALNEAADEIERLRAIVKDLHHHLGEGLYSDEWKTREYAIASHSRYDKEPF